MIKELVMYGNKAVEDNIHKFLDSKLDYDVLTVDQKKIIVEKLERACKSCELHYETPYRNVPAIVNPGSRYIFIGRNPNGTEAMSNSLFPDGSTQGYIFKRYLISLGIGQSEMSVLNMCYCYGKKSRPVAHI